MEHEIANSGLVGVWSADARYDSGGQCNEILSFRANGIGWMELCNFNCWTATYFEWTPTSPGWVAISGVKNVKPHEHDKRKIVESAASLNLLHLPFSVREEETPSGKTMKVLRIEVLNSGENAFGYINSAAPSAAETRGYQPNL